MITVKVVEVQTRSFNILNKLYKLTRNGDIKISNYCNRYFKPVSVNNADYTRPTGA